LADTIRIVRGELTVHSALEEKRLDVVGRRALSSPADSACGLQQGRHEPADSIVAAAPMRALQPYPGASYRNRNVTATEMGPSTTAL